MAGHKFHPDRWERLVSPERFAMLDPNAFADRLHLEPGNRVADIGAGPGFFTFPLAQRVGPHGKVYAVDVSMEMLERLRERGPPEQVELVHSRENDLPLESGAVDLALLAFVLHELTAPDLLLGEIRRILVPGGRLAVLEWIPQVEEMGPPIQERMTPQQSRAVVAAAGFVIDDEANANVSNYYLIARSPGGGR